MLNNLRTIISEVSDFPKRLVPVASEYIHYLTLQTKRHSFKGAAEVSGRHESRFCAFLQDPKAPDLSLKLLNRATRRSLRKIQRIDDRYVILIDATIKGRRGKKVENSRKYHSGSGFTIGHKFVNFVILTPSGPIPLVSIPIYSNEYCKEYGIEYRTENEIVEAMIIQFGQSEIFSENQLKMATFIMDSGYDVKEIQKSVREIGANFVVALKSNRTIEGKQVYKYFNENRRWLPWIPIRLRVGNGGKNSRRTYSIRTATGLRLKGFGPVTVVCSKATHRSRRTMKYLAASDPRMTGKQIVVWYSRRWAIELWHKEMKQNFGFGDCHSARFSAIEAHVNLTLTAYLIQKDTGRSQLRIEEYTLFKQLKEIRTELTRFGALSRLKTRIDEVILDMPA
jgi:hypothetical protein